MKLVDDLKRNKAILLLAVSLLLIAFAPMPELQTEPQIVNLQIQAESFAFSPGIVRVNPGDQVVLELTSTDVVHGLYLDRYDLSITADPGQTESLSFTADQAGVFRFRCSVTCGALHPFMIGQLKVGTNVLLWRGIMAALVLGVFGLWSFRREQL